MVLTDKEIKTYIKNRKLRIDPYNPGKQLQSSSIDLHLDNKYLKMKESNEIITLDKEIEYEEIEKDEIFIPGKSFILGTTKEYVSFPSSISTLIEGKSTIGRIGLFIQNAGFINPGFEGKLTLELFNANNLPIKIKAGKAICQLVLMENTGNVENLYKDVGAYQNQDRVAGANGVNVSNL